MAEMREKGGVERNSMEKSCAAQEGNWDDDDDDGDSLCLYR